MIDEVELQIGHCTDSMANTYLRLQPEAEATSWTASLYGPQCQFSRTLASDFCFRSRERGDPRGLFSVLITEPCYWTPALPFLYQLNVEIAGVERTASIGLRRWTCAGQSFRLEGRRMVLRGAAISIDGDEDFANARHAEMAMLADAPSADDCAAADRMGVPLIVDLRGAGDRLFSTLDRLDWSASVLIALVSAEQLADADVKRHWPRQCLLARCVTAASTPDELVDPHTAVLAVELAPGERPPPWLADIDRPLVAIRHGVKYDSPAVARQACDRLQAELAPEFNLAGYFVSP